MTTAASNITSSTKATQIANPNYETESKYLEFSDPYQQELWDYRQDLVAWWTAVQNGQEQGTPEQVAQAQQYLAWVDQQLGYSGGGFGADPFGGADSEPNTKADGGFRSPNGEEWVYNLEDNEINFTGDAGVSRIWGNAVINVAPTSARVTVEWVEDDSVSPPKRIRKVVIHDDALDVDHIYFLEDEDATLTIRTPKESQVQDLTGGTANLTWEKFTNQSTAPRSPESDHEGTAVEGKDNTYEYEADSVNDVINFDPEGNGVDETHYVVGSANFNIPLSSSVDVYPSNDSEYGYKMVVTHKDGSKDIYYLKESDSFDFNINAIPENVEWHTDAGSFGPHDLAIDPADLAVSDGTGGGTVSPTPPTNPPQDPGHFGDDIPDLFKDHFTLNEGVDGMGGTDEPSEDYLDDTPPSRTNDDGTKAFYEEAAEVFLTPNFDDDITEHWITATQGFTLNILNLGDEVIITMPPNSTHKFKIEVKRANGGTEVFYVDGLQGPPHDDGINIQGVASNNVSGDGLNSPIVKINGTDQKPGLAEAWQNYNIDGEIEMQPDDIDGQNNATTLNLKITQAFLSGDWSQVEDFLNSLGDEKVNDCIRTFIMAVGAAAGGYNTDKFDEIMDMIKPEVRYLMADRVTAKGSEINERRGTTLDSGTTAEKILETLAND